ncbi:MAG: hypothetical protein WC313_00760 [Candidatus Kapaibacterium sp.]|jgi:hypothetical protein|nr:hypothetical protein [Candidatus Kapabacteria bacterium]
MKLTLKELLKILITISVLIFVSCSSIQQSDTKAVGRFSLDEWLEIIEAGAKPEHIFSVEEISKFKSMFGTDFLITIFASSDCNECAESLPYFLNLVQQSEIDSNQVSIFGLDAYWEEPSGIYKEYKISEIPIVFIELQGVRSTLTKSEFSDINKILDKLNGK